MTASRKFSFGPLVEHLCDRMPWIGAACITLALASITLRAGNNVVLYVGAALMFVIVQLFILRWVLRIGLKSTDELGFTSNRRAFWYSSSLRGFDRRLLAVALYGFAASVVLGFLGMGNNTATGALLLTITSSTAVTQAMHLRRIWPVDVQAR